MEWTSNGSESNLEGGLVRGGRSVLYELLTGKRAFGGKTVTDTLAKVLEGVPDLKALPKSTPWRIQELLRRCLTKDPDERLLHVGEARIQIKKALKEPAESPTGVAGAVQPPFWRRAVPWSIAALALLIAGVALWNLSPSSTPSSLTRLALTLPAGDHFTTLGHEVVALSPDGSLMVYGANEQLYLRAMDQLESRPISGTEGADGPFFSSDGQWVGFTAGNKLKKVAISGGAPMTLSDDANLHGATWGTDDAIIFAPSSGIRGLYQVSAGGGTPVLLTTPDFQNGEISHPWPQLLPGGGAVIYTVGAGGSWDDAQIVVEQIETRERRVLIEGGTHGRYIPTGHLVYARANTLMAVPFDLARLEVTGSPVPVVEGVMQGANSGVAHFAFSDLGSLVYVPGGTQDIERTLVWVNRQGEVEPLAAPPRTYDDPRLSPDGGRLAVQIFGATSDVWIYDILRKTMTRLTFEGSNDGPLWTPDGQRVTFDSTRAGGPGSLFWKPADGSGAAEQLTTTSQYRNIATSWSPDGKMLAFSESGVNDIWVLPFEGESKPQPFLQTPFLEGAARFSPDGRWVAYTSNESGRFEIYVQPFPGPGGKWQISTEGGTEAVWAGNGQELFYRNGEQMLAVDITTQPAFSAGSPELLFEGQYFNDSSVGYPAANYDVTPDGQRFLMIREEQPEVPQINVVLNWFEELKRLVPGP